MDNYKSFSYFRIIKNSSMELQKNIVNYSNVCIERADKIILSDVSLNVSAGELVTIEGPIGSGKSSLFKTFYADLPVKSGEASVLGFDLRKIPSRKVSKLRRRMGIVFQEYQLFNNKTVEGNLDFVISSLDFKTPIAKVDYINQILDKVGISGKSNTFPHMLSGGERQSVAIARAIVCNPELIIADEPTGNLDDASAAHVAEVLSNLAQDGAAVIVATHDENAFKDFKHRTLFIQDTHLIEE